MFAIPAQLGDRQRFDPLERDFSAWREWLTANASSADRSRLELPTWSQWAFALWHDALPEPDPVPDFTYVRSEDGSGDVSSSELCMRLKRDNPEFGFRTYKPGQTVRRCWRLVWAAEGE